jgi:putative transposase
MARKKHSPEQIVAILRQIEVEVANHKPTGQACREAGITEQAYYRWRKEYGGLKLEQARRMKQLEKEKVLFPDADIDFLKDWCEAVRKEFCCPDTNRMVQKGLEDCSSNFGLGPHSEESHFPQADFWPGIISG